MHFQYRKCIVCERERVRRSGRRDKRGFYHASQTFILVILIDYVYPKSEEIKGFDDFTTYAWNRVILGASCSGSYSCACVCVCVYVCVHAYICACTCMIVYSIGCEYSHKGGIQIRSTLSSKQRLLLKCSSCLYVGTQREL